MERKPITVRKRAKVMTDPLPSRASLVRAGANLTPLRVIKAEEIEDVAMNLKKGNVDIARIVFTQGDRFKSESDVREWLDSGGYEPLPIVSVDTENFKGFTVSSKAQPEALSEIEVADDIVVFVAEGVDATSLKADTGAQVVAIGGEATEEPKTGARKEDSAEKPAEQEAEELPAGDILDPADVAAAGEELPAVDATKKQEEAPAVLLGSDKLDATIDIGDTEPVQLGTIVALAQKSSGLSVDDWNGLSADYRDGKLAATIETLKAETAHRLAGPPQPKDEEMGPLLVKAEDGELSLVTQKSVYDITELNSILQALSYIRGNINYETYNGTYGPDIATKYRAIVVALGELLVAVTVANVQEVAKSETEANAEVTSNATAAKGEGATATDKSSTLAVSEAAKSDDPVMALTGLVEKVVDAVSGLTAKVEQSSIKAEQALAMAEGIRASQPTRKSADVEELAGSRSTASQKSDTDNVTSISAGVRERNSRNMLGI